MTADPQTRAYAIKVELDPTPEQVVYMLRLMDMRRVLYRQTLVWDLSVHGSCPWQPGSGKLRKHKDGSPRLCKPQKPLREGIPTALINPVEKAYRQSRERWSKGNGGMPRVPTEGCSVAWQVTQIDSTGLSLPGTGRGAEKVRYKEDPCLRLDGKVEKVTISRDVDRYFASFAVTQGRPVEQTVGDSWVGIDANSATHVGYVLSDGTRYPLPESLITAEAKRERLQHDLARHLERARRAALRNGCTAANHRKWRPRSARHQRMRDKVAKAYRSERRIRENWLHHVTTEITRKYKHIAIEDLNVAAMTRSARGSAEAPGKNVSAKAGLNRGILRAAFGDFRRQLEYKAKWRGCVVYAIDPAYTSRDCSRCGVRNPKSQEYRTFVCEECGHTEDRDDNAAVNIEFRGRKFAKIPAGSGCMGAESASAGVEAPSSWNLSTVTRCAESHTQDRGLAT